MFISLGAHFDDSLIFNKSTTLLLHKSLVLLYFDYGSIIYYVTSKVIQNRLQLVKNSLLAEQSIDSSTGLSTSRRINNMHK